MTKRIQVPMTEGGVLISQGLLNGLAIGYDFENRSIYMFGEINEAAAYRFISGFKWLDRMPGPIHIVLNSPGGDLDSGSAMYDAIRTANNPVIIEGTGIIASAAVPLLLAGTARFVTPGAFIMVHYLSWEVDGKISSPVMASMSEVQDRLNARYVDIIAERTSRPKEEVETWCEEERYFDANESVQMGFADKIVEVRELPKSFALAEQEITQSMIDAGVIAKPKEKKEKVRRGKK